MMQITSVLLTVYLHCVGSTILLLMLAEQSDSVLLRYCSGVSLDWQCITDSIDLASRTRTSCCFICNSPEPPAVGSPQKWGNSQNFLSV